MILRLKAKKMECRRICLGQNLLASAASMEEIRVCRLMIPLEDVSQAVPP